MDLLFYSTEIHLQSVVAPLSKNNNNNNNNNNNDESIERESEPQMKTEKRIQVKNIVNIAVLPTPEKVNQIRPLSIYIEIKLWWRQI